METTKIETPNGNTNRPTVNASMVRRVADFVLTADAMRDGYSDDVRCDATWSAIFVSADATIDEMATVIARAAT
jgi:hypothetical protein